MTSRFGVAMLWVSVMSLTVGAWIQIFARAELEARVDALEHKANEPAPDKQAK